MGPKSLKDRRDEIDGLILLIQRGNQEAFSQLYDILIDPVYKYIFYRVNAADVEDITETVFLKIWENVRKYKIGKKPFTAWVFRIAHNLVVDHYRENKDETFRELDESLPDTNREHNPIHRAERSLDNVMLKKALKQVKRVYRDVLIYKFINEFSNEEIAEILGKNEGSLRVIQFRALKALKKELLNLGAKIEF